MAGRRIEVDGHDREMAQELMDSARRLWWAQARRARSPHAGFQEKGTRPHRIFEPIDHPNEPCEADEFPDGLRLRYPEAIEVGSRIAS